MESKSSGCTHAAALSFNFFFRTIPTNHFIIDCCCSQVPAALVRGKIRRATGFLVSPGGPLAVSLQVYLSDCLFLICHLPN